MELRPLDGRPDARGALRVNRDAWRAAYAHTVSDEVLSRLAAAPTPEEADRWHETLGGACADGRVLVADRSPPSGRPDIAGYAHVRLGDDTKEFVDDDEAGLKEIYVAPTAGARAWDRRSWRARATRFRRGSRR